MSEHSATSVSSHALVVVTLDSDDDTTRLLDVAMSAGYDAAVVVDCGGTSRIDDHLPGFGSMKVSVLRPGSNIGYGPGCDLGASHAIEQGATVLVFANPDINCDAATLSALAFRCKEGELVAPVLRRPDGRVFRGGVLNPSSGATAAKPGDEVTWVSSALAALTTGDWQAVGGFDPRFFIYWDDVDLCTRFISSGGRLSIDERLLVAHRGGGAHRRGRADHFYSFLNCRNRLLYAQKHAESPVELFRWVLGSVRYVALVSDLPRQGSAGRVVACIAGTLVGLVDFLWRGKWGQPPNILIRRD